MKTMKTVALAATLVLTLLASRAVFAADKPSDEDQVKVTVGKIKEALEKKDINLLMATFSESYKDPRVGGKAEAKALLEQGLKSGYADNGKVKIDALKVKFSEDKKTAKAYPLDLSSSMGSISVELVLGKEKDAWLVTQVNPDGV